MFSLKDAQGYLFADRRFENVSHSGLPPCKSYSFHIRKLLAIHKNYVCVTTSKFSTISFIASLYDSPVFQERFLVKLCSFLRNLSNSNYRRLILITTTTAGQEAVPGTLPTFKKTDSKDKLLPHVLSCFHVLYTITISLLKVGFGSSNQVVGIC